MCSFHLLFSEFLDLHVDASFGATTCINSLLNQRLFSTSSGHMSASHAINHGCLVVFACCKTASSRASFLGVQPSECQKYTEKTPQTSSDVHRCLGNSSFVSRDRIYCPSSAPTTVPRSLSAAKKTSPDVCFRSYLLALLSVILAASAANLHPSLASLLNSSSIFCFLNLCSFPNKISHFPLFLLMYFCLCSRPIH